MNPRNQDLERLALFLPSLRGGGAERVMLTLANCLAARGYTVDLVLVKAEGPYLEDVSSKVRIVDLKASRVATSAPRLTQYLRRTKPIALLSAMSHANVVAGVSRILSRGSTRLVFSEHNDLSGSSANDTTWTGGVLLYLMRWVYKKADCVVAVSGGVADSLALTIGYPRDRVQVIYNPIVNDAMVVRSQKPLEHPWLSSSKIPVVLGIGRLVEQKNFVLLVRAFARLHKRMNARLIILGEGECRPELEKLVRNLGLSEFVALPGFVNNPYAYLSRASVFALSSRWEGLPTVLIEAMACGTPVVSTECPSGPTEILQQGRWGPLVPVGDAVALGDALFKTLKNTEQPAVSQRAADFGIEQAADNYLRVLNFTRVVNLDSTD